MNIDKAIRETENKLALLKAAKAVMGSDEPREPRKPRSRSRRRMTEQEAADIRQLRAQGAKLQEIAARTKRSESTIWNVLHRNNGAVEATA